MLARDAFNEAIFQRSLVMARSMLICLCIANLDEGGSLHRLFL